MEEWCGQWARRELLDAKLVVARKAGEGEDEREEYRLTGTPLEASPYQAIHSLVTFRAICPTTHPVPKRGLGAR